MIQEKMLARDGDFGACPNAVRYLFSRLVCNTFYSLSTRYSTLRGILVSCRISFIHWSLLVNYRLLAYVNLEHHLVAQESSF